MLLLLLTLKNGNFLVNQKTLCLARQWSGTTTMGFSFIVPASWMHVAFIHIRVNAHHFKAASWWAIGRWTIKRWALHFRVVLLVLQRKVLRSRHPWVLLRVLWGLHQSCGGMQEWHKIDTNGLLCVNLAKSHFSVGISEVGENSTIEEGGMTALCVAVHSATWVTTARAKVRKMARLYQSPTLAGIVPTFIFWQDSAKDAFQCQKYGTEYVDHWHRPLYLVGCFSNYC